MQARMQDIWKSYRSLPTWVQIWMALLLVPVNVAPFFLLDTWIGTAGALAAIFVVVTNGPILWVCRGMSRLLAVPHLFAWIPLQIAIALRLTGHAGDAPLGDAECALGLALFAVNGVSLAFDALDSWRWWRGEREVPGIG